MDWVIDGKPVQGAAARPPASRRSDRGASPSRGAAEADSGRRVEIAIHPEDPYRGNPKAAVKVVTFSDFQ